MERLGSGGPARHVGGPLAHRRARRRHLRGLPEGGPHTLIIITLSSSSSSSGYDDDDDYHYYYYYYD